MQKKEIYLALIRGINVGGNNKIAMTELKACFEKLGFKDVQTFGNSGNVIFSTKTGDSRELEVMIEKSIEKTFAINCVVLVRSEAEMKKVVDSIPPTWDQDPDKKYDVMFLRKEIDSLNILQELKPNPDLEEIYYHPGVIFWSINTKEFGKSYVPKIVGKKIYQSITIRTPKVVRKFYALMSTLTD